MCPFPFSRLVKILLPFVKKFSVSERQRSLLDDSSANFFPPTFLQDLRDSDEFSVHIAIGIPENSVVPTLSYSDFNALSSVNSVNWQNIKKYIHAKYEKRAQAGDDEVAKRFSASLTEHKANLKGKFSVLVAPGFWQNFASIPQALRLAQSIISSSNFKVFVIASGHKASNAFNAHELNPHIMGYILDKEVTDRFFRTAPVCLGEYVGQDLRVDLEQNVHNFFLMAVQRFVKVPPVNAAMLRPLNLFNPKTYVSSAASFYTGEDSFFVSCAQKDRKVLDFVPFGDAGIRRRLVPDYGRVWYNYSTSELFTDENG